MAPAAVSTTKGVTLADRLKLNELPLATTPAGKVFCLKALHPSEHTIRATRVPGGNKPSVAICCDMIQTFPIATAASVVQIAQSPNIIVPASITIVEPGGVTLTGNFYNAAFGGAYVATPTYNDTVAVMTNMYPRISQYRITSQSVTCELIAPSLRDQGTITAAQFDMNPMTLSPCYLDSSDALIKFRPDCYAFPEAPSASKLLLGTTAYTSKAREGCYMPLKLTKFKWMDMHDMMTAWQMPSGYIDQGRYSFSEAVGNSLTFPFHENRTGLTNYADVPEVPKLCGSVGGVVVFEGMDANVAIRVRVRQVVEIVAPPSTTYAPLLESPLPPDDLSLRMYYEISGRMADAYPAAYNDLGKLLETISSIGKQILPYIDPALDAIAKTGIPVVSTAAGVAKTVKDAATKVSQTVKKARSRKNKGNGQSKKNLTQKTEASSK